MRLLDALAPVRRIKAGEAAGMRLVCAGADRSMSLGTYDAPMQQAIAAHLSVGDVFFDVGANIGFFSLLAAKRVGTYGRVYAFEPVARNAATIARNARLNSLSTVEVFAEAVGARTEPAELLVARHIGGAVLASVGAPPDQIRSVHVDVIALDDIMEQRGLRAPALVKIDVEGAELDVLHGMARTIKTGRPKIIYEIDDETVEGLQRKRREIAQFLAAAGYELSPLPVSYPDQDWHVEHVLARPAPA